MNNIVFYEEITADSNLRCITTKHFSVIHALPGFYFKFLTIS